MEITCLSGRSDNQLLGLLRVVLSRTELDIGLLAIS